MKNRIGRIITNKIAKIIYALLLAIAVAILNYFGVNLNEPSRVGEVVKVYDGDSFKVNQEQLANGQIRTIDVRIYGIDAPEFGQEGFFQAKNRLDKLINGQKVFLQIRGKDQFKRITADVFLDEGREVAPLLISEGLVWWAKSFAPNLSRYKELEKQARLKRLGIWKGKNPTPPWKYRSNSN